ncbi:uncharacterized protein LOC127832627 [Dreissena polymorpha]|uniref:NACHT domain-containing protein n=1 Tax=Dreissena polymorpha TaxID=45954 RepID=A0A9D4GNG7_DREPO|nr:uncharacterized protein LOC127832627 [Dreissena polymorpha]XP_052214122.1 uncharacterized protein LOC127832627 [Dreissena polymorpha]XP_052214123.1 uncharacterized protein LOC127832627 [Dreissena polymorpha]XP_052214124.1 uncharacterized protein LOC127832627 [Dreissena polymorpha]XP_052214126.1 uncharacterized protein LOC127832627 [Dreissena polymorpha]XP_052214127.1 uncharacterized protein LOC127832627 [Dreissena polymorpha]XP_052214128.1 uncharacterized protein LOC127832627 [Dreissena po
MASLADVFTEKERTNWLKAWLAVDIGKSGLDQFADNVAKTIHANIYNTILPSVYAPVACNLCLTANLLKCPTPGICNKRGANNPCKVHDTAAKQPRQCPANMCNKVFDEIKNLHKFSNPSWKNTRAEQWESNPWEIAKAYLPPDGYTEKISVQDTDFNGLISFMMNCKHFDSMFSFTVAPGNNYPPCLLTKAREIGRTVRHSSQCKLTDADLQDIFTTLTNLLTDPMCLARDVTSQEAVKKLAKLQNDGLKITTEEMINLLVAVQDEVKNVENTADKTLDAIRVHLEHCRNDVKEYTEKCKEKLDERTEKCEATLHERTAKCEEKLDERTAKCEEKLDKRTEKCEEKLDKYTNKCKDALDEHFRKSAESNYEQSCEDFRRRLMEHYNDTSSNVPLSALDQSLDKRITEIYATPKIHRIDIKKDGTRKKEEQINSYKEMFYRNEIANRRIYVQGEPGSGKSTFAAKLVYDWCNGIQPLSTALIKNTAFDDVMTISKFKFLFFISLRDVREQKTVTQMIKSQLVDRMYSDKDVERVSELVYKIIETEVCLIVRDGLDEWVAPDGYNLAEPSLTGFQKDKCTIITTARPWKLADERIKNSQIDILLEIDGICNADKFCEQILGCIIDEDKDLVKTVVTFIEFVKRRKLESLSSSPMLFTAVICMWVDNVKDEEQLKESSLCAFYTVLLESLCKKANCTTGYFKKSTPSPVECFSNTCYLQPNIDHLDNLAAAACKLLFSFERETSIVFSDITLSNYISREVFTECKTFALKAGILTNRKDKSRTGSSNSFIHLTIQEFLAAYYIARNASVIDDIIDGYLKRYTKPYLDIIQVFLFLCGMNIVAANQLSALMNEYDIAHSELSSLYWPSEFQKTILDGINEAAANKQDDICPKLSCVCITEENIQDLHRVWSANTSNVQLLTVQISEDKLRARGQPKTHYVFSLLSCHKLKQLYLQGDGILLKASNTEGKAWPLCTTIYTRSECVEKTQPQTRDSASLAETERPVWIVFNNADPTSSGDPPPELPSIQYIQLEDITCSSSWLRSLLSTLLTLDHEVRLTLEACVITWSVEDAVRQSDTYTTIRTGVNNTIYVCNDLMFNSGIWEALKGLNIKWLAITGLNEDWTEHVVESVSKSLQSLRQLDTLNIRVNDISPDMWEALHSLNIKNVTLNLNGKWSGLIVNHVSRLSQVLISPTQIKTIYIDVNVHPDLLEALCGLHIKSISLLGRGEHLKGNRVSALCYFLSSLKQIDKLYVIVNNDSPGLWKAFHGLNIKSLSLGGGLRCVRVNHVSALAQLLASLIHLDTLSIEVSEDSPGLWEALRDLNITRLSLNWSDSGGEVSALSQSLASLTRLETLSIKLLKYSQGQWETLRGLNITNLCLSWNMFAGVNHESMLQSLSSLTKLETLSINVKCDGTELWQGLNGLNIKSLRLGGLDGGVTLLCKEYFAQALSSFSQLETLTLYLRLNSDDLQLPQSLKFLNIYSDRLRSFEIRKLLDTLSDCTQRVEIKLEFGCAFKESKEQYIADQQELETLGNVKITRFLIYNWKPSIETGSDWCVQNVVVDVDGHDDDIGDDEQYKLFIEHMSELYRISLRFRIN